MHEVLALCNFFSSFPWGLIFFFFFLAKTAFSNLCQLLSGVEWKTEDRETIELMYKMLTWKPMITKWEKYGEYYTRANGSKLALLLGVVSVQIAKNQFMNSPRVGNCGREQRVGASEPSGILTSSSK